MQMPADWRRDCRKGGNRAPEGVANSDLSPRIVWRQHSEVSMMMA